jgi:hypothetical protein
MKLNALKKIALIALLAYAPLQSMAWGQLGHRVVGQIAESHLNAKAKLAIKNILGNETLAMSSNWADFVKSDNKFNYLGNWHYINFASGLGDAEVQNLLKSDTAVNVHTKINFLIKELKNKNLPKDKKVMYVRLLVHFVGDIHQPFHAGHLEDKGGNDVRVSWFGKSSNIHAIWDSELVEQQQLSYTEYAKAINFCSAKQKVAWQNNPLSQWIGESYRIAEKVYNEVKPGDKLGYRHNYDYIETINQQLLKGGVRLAGVFNQIFGS